jgi:predicted ribosome quality control (RQC) complex YloA/Tae2 family protein
VKLQTSFDNVNEKLKVQEDYKDALEGKVKVIKAKQVEIDQLKKLLVQEEERCNAKINDFLDKISTLNEELSNIQKTNDELYRENSGKF